MANFFAVVGGLPGGIYDCSRNNGIQLLHWQVIAPNGVVRGLDTDEHPSGWNDWTAADFTLLKEYWVVRCDAKIGPVLTCATERTAQNHAAMMNLDDPQHIYTVQRVQNGT